MSIKTLYKKTSTKLFRNWFKEHGILIIGRINVGKSGLTKYGAEEAPHENFWRKSSAE